MPSANLHGREHASPLVPARDSPHPPGEVSAQRMGGVDTRGEGHEAARGGVTEGEEQEA